MELDLAETIRVHTNTEYSVLSRTRILCREELPSIPFRTLVCEDSVLTVPRISPSTASFGTNPLIVRGVGAFGDH